ncbi:MAG: acyl carrier protein, partial [Enhygromyxa sp.]
RLHHVLEFVRSEAAVVLGVASPQEVSPDQPLQEIGLDSLMAVELRNRLQAPTGIQLTATLLFDYPTAKKIAGLLLSKLTDQLAPARPSTSSGPQVVLSEEEVRRRISRISIQRLRDSRLLDALLELSDACDDLGTEPETSIDEMSVDDLIDLALSED